jgi:hypothetical protein
MLALVLEARWLPGTVAGAQIHGWTGAVVLLSGLGGLAIASFAAADGRAFTHTADAVVFGAIVGVAVAIISVAIVEAETGGARSRSS